MAVSPELRPVGAAGVEGCGGGGERFGGRAAEIQNEPNSVSGGLQNELMGFGLSELRRGVSG
jgi:hypothetical protein